MRTLLRKKYWLMLLLPPAILLLAVAWYFNLFALTYYGVATAVHADQWRDNSLWLPSYRVAVDARPIAGIDNNASGLSYNEDAGTLFSVINKPPQIAELTLDGELLRLIPVAGVDDLEGIAHVKDDLFILTDERSHQLYLVNVPAAATSVDVVGAPQLGLGIELHGNLGFEGVSWDAVGQRLFIAKEKSPMRVFDVYGLTEWLDGSAFNLQIREWRPKQASAMVMRDLSSVNLHEQTGHLLLLSDESKLVVEYAADGTLVSMLPLWRGWHGLKASVPQAEGLTVGPDGAVYILSEPNLFYRFERDRR